MYPNFNPVYLETDENLSFEDLKFIIGRMQELLNMETIRYYHNDTLDVIKNEFNL